MAARFARHFTSEPGGGYAAAAPGVVAPSSCSRCRIRSRRPGASVRPLASPTPHALGVEGAVVQACAIGLLLERRSDRPPGRSRDLAVASGAAPILPEERRAVRDGREPPPSGAGPGGTGPHHRPLVLEPGRAAPDESPEASQPVGAARSPIPSRATVLVTTKGVLADGQLGQQAPDTLPASGATPVRRPSKSRRAPAGPGPLRRAKNSCPLCHSRADISEVCAGPTKGDS